MIFDVQKREQKANETIVMKLVSDWVRIAILNFKAKYMCLVVGDSDIIFSLS